MSLGWVILISALSGAALTGGGFLVVNRLGEDEPPVIVEHTAVIAEKKAEVVKQLTNTDLLVIPCGDSFIAAYGQGLCREMFCRMMEKGLDTSVSSSECSAISNLLNTKVMLGSCQLPTKEEREDCFRLFRERK